MFNVWVVFFFIIFLLVWLIGCSVIYYGEIYFNNVKVKFIFKKEGLFFYLVLKIKLLELFNVLMSKILNSSDIFKLFVNV